MEVEGEFIVTGRAQGRVLTQRAQIAQRSRRDRGGVELVEHEVDDDAGDGDVEPNGESPAGNATMKLELASQGAANGQDYQGNDCDG